MTRKKYVNRPGSYIALAFCLAALGAGLNAATPRKGTPRPAAMTAAAYAARVAGIDTCEQFRSLAPGLPDAGPLLSALGAGESEAALKKGEYETSVQFEERLKTLWAAKLGDPGRLIVRIPIESFKITYDADRQVSTVKYMMDGGIGSYQWMKFARQDTDRREYVGSNAFGVTTNVTSLHRTEDALYFKSRQLSGTRGGVFSPEWDIQLPPDQARDFKDAGSILLMVSLTAPYIETKSRYSAATLDAPMDLATREHKINVELKCAFFAARGTPIGDITIVERAALWDRM